MILAIILFILLILFLTLIILFSFYIFLPSLDTENLDSDAVISDKEKDFALKEKEEPPVSENRALVLCSCKKEFSRERSVFNEAFTCFMAKDFMGSGTDCRFSCIGLGDCIKVCPQNAIIIKNGTAVVSSRCCGCGKCAEICPQKIIRMIPKDTASAVLCNNSDSDSFTTCSCKQKEEKIERNVRKDFKIWTYWYRIIEAVNKLFK